MSSSVLELIKKYQHTIEKYPNDEKKLLRCIEKLDQLDVTVKHLEDTGVGRTVNALRKEPGPVGEASRALVKEWKYMVATEEKSDPEDYAETTNHYNGNGDDDHSPTYTQSPSYEYGKKKTDGDSYGSNKRKYEDNNDSESDTYKKARYSNNEESNEEESPVTNHHDEDNQNYNNDDDNESYISEYSEEEVMQLKAKADSPDRNSSKKSEDKYSKHKEKEKEKHSKYKYTNDKHKSKENSSKHSSLNSNSDKSSKSKKSKHESKSSQKHESASENSSMSKSHKSNDSDRHSSSEKERSKKHKSSKEKSDSSKDRKKHKSSDRDKSEKKSSDKTHKSSESKSKSSSSKESSSKSKSSSDSKSKHSSKDESSKKHKSGNNDTIENGIDCGSGASFAEALGMISPVKAKKKIVSSPRGGVNDLMPTALLSSKCKLAPLPPLEISALPEISPNYKPMPPPKLLPHFSDGDAMNAGISSKNQRTKVYSGNKTVGKVYTLYELCVQVLQMHIDSLEYTGGVPYEILKPVVDRATPEQLFVLENYNPYLMEDTQHLWEAHCKKRFRNKQREEMETWRDMYIRCQDEQEVKLRSLTANIKMAQEVKKAPVKQTKMAYVDSVVKPPRNILRKQAQHGTARATTASPAARVPSLAAAPNVLTPGSRASHMQVVTNGFKPKKAPLMQKALQFMRGRKR